ncbi:hypothetical protein NM688_g7318 [Phlebia brevispora]|uniref:Uncharacterized protein n=1 Tax=Phlebia brevispora TaxID=194682 RepID=A0ACC1S6Q4_9APHY|nr:hypothetical protein NM688_g7318 [Phlebia brevispora]
MFTDQALILFCVFMFYLMVLVVGTFWILNSWHTQSLQQHRDDINLIIMHIERAYRDTHPSLPANNNNDNVDAGAWGNVPDVNGGWGDNNNNDNGGWGAIDDNDVQQGWSTIDATAAPSVVSD